MRKAVKKVGAYLLSAGLSISVMAVSSVSYADTISTASPGNQGSFTLPVSQGLTGSHTVSFDHYSLMIDGKRTFIYSGEFDYWRLPSQSEWMDVLQKMKVAGFNAVTIYFNWDFHSPAQGKYDFTGIRDVDKLLTMAQEVGLYVIARPGPYVNAETDGGGFPGWLMTQSGRARSSAPDYTAAYKEWMSAVDPIIAKHQITKGGSVILYQVENEYTGGDATYMQGLIDKAHVDEINVPLFHNDKSGPSGRWASGKGAPDMYAFDSYPSVGGLPTYYGDSHNFAPNTPAFVAELGGGWFDPWGGKGFPALAQTHNSNYENIVYNHVVSEGVTMMSIYMTYGGTNWGYLPFPGVYTSYDYTAAISESRQLGSKYNEEKLLATMYQTLTPLTKTDTLPVQAPSNSSLLVNAMQNPDTGTQFYVLRHSNGASTSSDTTSLTMKSADGNYTVPQQPNTSIAVNGQESKFLVANYALGSEHLVYSTSNLYTYVTQGNRDTALFYGGQGSDGETVLRYAQQPTVTVLSGNVTSKYDAASGDLRLNYTHDGSIAKVLIQDGSKELLLLLTTDTTAQTFWHNDTSNGAVLIKGPYLVRSASLEADGILALQGDNDKATAVELFGPSSVNQITWNGVPVNALQTASGSYTFSLSDPAPVTIPQLTSWKFSYETPEAQPSFDDSSWVNANKTTTNNPTKPSTPTVLYADEYGFHHGVVWFRGHFMASGNETGITLDGEGGDNGAYSVWLNGSYLGSSLSGTKTFSFPTNVLNTSGDNVVSVMVQNMGHDEDGGSNDSQKNPRGLIQASLKGASTSITWKLQGNRGGENLTDPVRGVMNAGGLYGENNGWALPNYPDQSWTQVSLPDSWAQRGLPEGVSWYRTSFNLDFPTMSDVPLGLNISDSAVKNYRAYIYINGWLVGQYINNLGPQHLFSLPPGVLNPNGKNTVAIAVWALDGSSTGLGQVSLQQLGNYAGGVPVQVNDSPDYESIFAGTTPSQSDNAVLSLSSPSAIIGGGKTQTITGVLTNQGTNPILVSNVTLNAPIDWVVSLNDSVISGTLAPGQSQTVKWDLTASAYYPGYLVQLTAKATYTDTKEDTTSAMLSLGSASISSTAVSGITLDKSILHLLPGTTMPLIPIITPADAYNKAVTWSSSDTTVATVDQNGNVTGVALGNAVITAKTVDGGFTKSADITVQADKTAVMGISLSTDVYNFASDYFSGLNPLSSAPKTQLIASIQPVDATNVRVTWTSDNPSVAAVDSSGVVTGLKEGIAHITAATEDGQYAKTSTVYVPTVSESFENQAPVYSWGVTKGSTAGAISAAVGSASGVTGQVLNFSGSGTGARSAYKTFAAPIANNKIQLALDWNIGSPSGGTGQLRIQDSSHNNYITFGVPTGGTSGLLYTTSPSIASNTALSSSSATLVARSGFATANVTYHVNVVLDMTNQQISFTLTNKSDSSKTVTVNNVPFAAGVTYKQNLGALELYATRNSGASMSWNTWIDNFNVYKLSDTTAPVTVASVSPAAADGENSWYVHAAVVTLSGTDDLTGIAKTLYSVDNGTTWNTYTKPFSVDNNGTNSLQYYSIDNAGNKEDMHSLSIDMDLDGPKIVITQPTASSYSDAEDLTPQFTLNDLVSGMDVSKTTVTLDGQVITQDALIPLYTLSLGDHVYSVTAYDKAGNISTEAVTFQTKTSVDALQALITRFVKAGSIDNSGIANSLTQKLNQKEVKAFINEVEAQANKHIQGSVAKVLLRDAQALLK